MTRLSSRSDGRGRPVSEIISGWAAGNPRVRRAWLSADAGRVLVELQPVGDSEETLAIWMAHGDQWRAELHRELGAPVNLDWRDPDSEANEASADRADTLVYERAR